MSVRECVRELENREGWKAKGEAGRERGSTEGVV